MCKTFHFILSFMVFWSKADACISMKSSKDDGINIWPTDPTTGLPVAPTSASTLYEMTTTPIPTTTTVVTTTTPSPWPRIATDCPTTVDASTEPIPSNACDPGWTAFRRVKGVVCLKAFTDSQSDAGSRAACEAQNAALSGIENSNERDWIHEQFVSLVAGTMDTIFIYIGAQRKTACTVFTNVPESCNPPKTNSFMWTDTTVTGTDGFCPWWKDQPDNGGGNTVQAFLQFSIMAFPGPSGEYDAVQGGLDDTVGEKPLQGYVCSKLSNG